MNNLSTSIATTREQSERLLAMGVDPETADMCYNTYHDNADSKVEADVNHAGANLYKDTMYIPAWSLSRIISMMPSEITVDRKVGSLFISHIDISYFGFESDKTISFLIGFEKGANESFFGICIDMIEWLVKNGHLKGGKP